MKIEQNYNLSKIQEFTESKVDQNQKKETDTAKKDVFETIAERQPSIFDVQTNKRFPSTSKETEMADEQKARYDESKKLFKLAVSVITEHEERTSQVTKRLKD